MTLAQLEKRVAKLEREIGALSLQREILNGRTRTGKWYVDHAGMFRGDPVYAEIVRRGRAYRESLRPKRGKGKRR